MPNSGSNYNTTKNITIINPNLPLTMAVDSAAMPKPAAAAASHAIADTLYVPPSDPVQPTEFLQARVDFSSHDYDENDGSIKWMTSRR